jgi:hypothetical protein
VIIYFPECTGDQVYDAAKGTCKNRRYLQHHLIKKSREMGTLIFDEYVPTIGEKLKARVMLKNLKHE